MKTLWAVLTLVAEDSTIREAKVAVPPFLVNNKEWREFVKAVHNANLIPSLVAGERSFILTITREGALGL